MNFKFTFKDGRYFKPGFPPVILLQGNYQIDHLCLFPFRNITSYHHTMTSSVSENSSLYPVLQNSTETTNLSTSSISYVNHNTIYRFSSPFNNPFEGIMAMLQLILCMLIFIGNSVTLFVMSVDKTLQRNIQVTFAWCLLVSDLIS